MTLKKLFLLIFSFLFAGLFPTKVYSDRISQPTNGNRNCPIIVNGDNVTIENVVCNENSSETSASENTQTTKTSKPIDSLSSNSSGYTPRQNPPPQISNSGGYTPRQNPPPQISNSGGYTPRQNPLPQMSTPYKDLSL